MPVLRILRHGLTAGHAPMKNSHPRSPRGEIEGWSEGATRRNTAFLRSIREPDLHGHGYASTLTLRDCPPSPDDWHRARRSWEKRMARAGMIRLHWVTEWQRRGVPHLHAAIWFPEPDPSPIIWHWIQVAHSFGASERGQNVTPISGPIGWFKYVSKHAARGVRHYQRNSDNIPESWQSKTGRVWGKSGHWPLCDALRIELDRAAFFAFRRIVRAWRKADARASGDVYRILTARSMLKSHDRTASELRPVSEWIPDHDQLRVLDHLAALGHKVRS